jgi:hypothetical protein
MVKIYGVITGDIVNSTRMKREYKEILFDMFSEALGIWGKDFGMRSETFRGDSFQCLINDPSNLLTIALIQKTFIKSLQLKNMTPKKIKNQSGFDVRIAMGIGTVDLASRIAASGGEAFESSGRLIDTMKNKRQTLAIATNDEFQEELTTEILLMDAILSKTTSHQCEVINLKLLGYTEAEIANRLHVGQSAVNQRSNSGSWLAIEAMINRFKKIYTHGQ